MVGLVIRVFLIIGSTFFANLLLQIIPKIWVNPKSKIYLKRFAEIKRGLAPGVNKIVILWDWNGPM